ncbi:MAG: uroporphyrinogen decarboxylase family protein [Acetivibrio sp.]
MSVEPEQRKKEAGRKMGAIKDYNCRYTNSVGIHEEIIKKLDLKFPDAYKNCATMAAIALERKAYEGTDYCMLPFCHTVEGEAFGGHINYGNGKIGPRGAEYKCSTMEEVLKLPEIDYQNGRIFEVLKACKELREQGENVILAISGPFTILNILIDPRHVFKVMKKNPDLRKQIFHKLEKELLTFLEKGITYGANIISYADSTGSLGILGPNLAEIVVEEFTYPFLKKAEKLPNGKAIIHLCPKTTFSLIGTKHACYEPVPVKKDSQYVSACIDAIGSAVFAGQMCIQNIEFCTKNQMLQSIKII